MKRCVLSFVLNFSKLIFSLLLLGIEFHRFGPLTMNDLLAKVCFLVCRTSRTSFLFSNIRPRWFVFFSLILYIEDIMKLFLCNISGRGS